MAKSNKDDRFSWKKGDVQIFKNASDLKKSGLKLTKPKATKPRNKG